MFKIYNKDITHKGIQTNENITIDVEKNEKIEVKDLHEKVKN